MLSDIRYALRTLRQSPAFALTAMLSIGLGIGANATIFSLADTLLFRPLPVPHSSQVVTIQSRTPSGPFDALSYADFADLRTHSSSFAAMAAYELTPFGFAADRNAQPQMQAGYLVSGNFFSAFEVNPALGRAFRPEEDQVPGRDAVLVLGHDFWKKEFASDPAVIGRRVRLNGLDFQVVGVAPESFMGLDRAFRPAFFVPVMMAPPLLNSVELLTNRSKRVFVVKGRLKTGISRQTANAEISALAVSLAETYPATNRSFGAAVRTELEVRGAFTQQAALVDFLFAIVGVVLLIACANVANLTFTRGRSRSREIAVRLAIGASRARLIRQLLSESLLIALGGCAVGLLVAEAGVGVLSMLQIPSDIPIELSFQLDYRVIGFAVLVSVLSTVLFGLAPALQSTRVDLVPALKSGEISQARRRHFGRNALVTVQVAGSLVLLVAATQLFRGFSYLMSHSPGFRTDHLVMLSFDPALIRYYNSQIEQFYRTLVDRAGAVPGVKQAALTYSVPMGTVHQTKTVIPEGYSLPPGQESLNITADTVDSNYFSVAGLSIVRGRGFLPTDRAGAPPVAVVNRAFADHYLGENPIGHRLRLNGPDGSWVQVVGVTATSKYLSLLEPPIEFLYLPLAQNPETRMTLLAQTDLDPAQLASPLRDMVHSIDPNLPVFGVRTMDDFVEQRSIKPLNVVIGIVAALGLIGLGLAQVGLYAVVAYQVARRTREIGIRMAIGSDRWQVVRMILKQAAVMGLTGVALGLVLSFAAGRALTVGLGLPSFDPLLFALVPVALLLTLLLAAAVPAHRASRVDPMWALRQD